MVFFKLNEIVVVDSRHLTQPDQEGDNILQIKTIEPEEGITTLEPECISLELGYPDCRKETEWVNGSELRRATEEDEDIFYLRVLPYA
jgi:hypothetical protein